MADHFLDKTAIASMYLNISTKGMREEIET